MSEELESMKEHKVWDIVPRPKDKRIIKSKWTYSKCKRRSIYKRQEI